jgi:7-carboxy-7-deazaguanine synthase
VAAKTGDTPDNTCAELDGVEIARRMLDRRSPHVVITGGEPAMYDLQELTEQIALAGIPVQVETSGTYELLLDGRTWVTCSPKFDMPGGRTVLRSALERADEIKMPVGKARDVESMRHRVLPFVRIGTPIWLQPLSASPAATRLCIEQAARNGWNVSIQSHKFIGIR